MSGSSHSRVFGQNELNEFKFQIQIRIHNVENHLSGSSHIRVFGQNELNEFKFQIRNSKTHILEFCSSGAAGALSRVSFVAFSNLDSLFQGLIIVLELKKNMLDHDRKNT